MATQDQLSKLPIAGIIALVAAAATAILWNRVPLEVPRPKGEHIEQQRRNALQDIDARLWEDPLTVINREEQQKGSDNASSSRAPKTKQRGGRESTAENLCEAVLGAEPAARILILGVLISNAPYIDVSEHRSRNRYAVHSALSTSHFVPTDSQHIGRFRYAFNDSGSEEGWVPFETFVRRPPLNGKDKTNPSSEIPYHVVVLWIEEEQVALPTETRPRPIWNVHKLMSRVESGCFSSQPDRKAQTRGTVKVDTAVIGPATSDTLRAMVIEAKDGQAEFNSLADALERTKERHAAKADDKKGIAKSGATEPEFKYRVPVFYSAFATSSAIDMLALESAQPRTPCGDRRKGVGPWPMADWRAQYIADPRFTGSVLYWYFRRCGIEFFSTVATDEELARVLIEELRKRDPDGVGINDEKYRVALVYERDTYYGRSLPRAFLRAAGARRPCEDDSVEMVRRDEPSEPTSRGESAPCRVLLYSYLRGLDGQAPAAPPEAGKKVVADSKEEAIRIAMQERAEGAKQFDYLRRLAGRIQRDNQLLQADAQTPWWSRMGRYGQTQIRAIGVFGTDIYDKIAVLRALRNEFPRAVFFTTDLDARMLDIDQNEWTRNVVVASSVGLELTPCLQKDVPPFRGVYQTSVYLAARLAVHNAFPYEETGRVKSCPQYPKHLGLPPYTGEPLQTADGRTGETRLKLSQTTVDKWLATPRLYEIGRTAPLALLDTPPRTLEAVGDVHPEADAFVPSTAALLTGVVVFVLLSGGLLLLRGPRSTVGEAWKFTSDLLHGDRGTWGWRVIVLVLIVVVIVLEALLLFAYIESAQRAGEPFRWFEGLSTWPTELLRSIALCLSVLFLFAACEHSEANLRAIEKLFGLKDCALANKGWRALWRWHLVWRRREQNRKRLERKTGIGHEKTDRRAEEASPPVDALWCDFTVRTSPEATLLRSSVWVVVFLVVGIALMELTGYPNLPARGAAAARLDQFLIFTVVPAFMLLLFLVADLHRTSEQFCRRIDIRSEWPLTAVRMLFPNARPTGEPHASTTASSPEGADEANPLDDPLAKRLIGVWLKAQLLVERSKAISPLVFLPLIVLALLVVARAGLFDAWGMPIGLVFLLAAGFFVCCFTAWLLHRSAEQVRGESLRELQRCLFQRQAARAPGAVTPDQIKLLIQRIENLREGAFVPPWERPVVVAGLLPLVGVGGLQLLQTLGLVPS